MFRPLFCLKHVRNQLCQSMMKNSSHPLTSIMLERVGAKKCVGLITMNKRRTYNALSTEMMKELGDAMHQLETDESVRAIVFTSFSQKFFCAGADISEISGLDYVTAYSGAFTTLFNEFAKAKKPTIAAVNGLCLGGGCEFAMSCDIVYAGSNAMFSQPEVNIGTVPGGGGSQRLTRAVGKSMAMEMILTGSRISANDALEAGLVSKVVQPDSLVSEAIKLGEKIASKDPVAVAMIRELINHSFENSLSHGLSFEKRYSHLAIAKKSKDAEKEYLALRK